MRTISHMVLPALIMGFLVSCSDKGVQSRPGSPGNTPPEITSAELFPEKPTANTQLIIRYKGKDSEGDSIQYTFRWYVDSEVVQEGPLGILEPGKYRKNSEVFVEILPADPFSAGDPFRTKPVTILNLPPEVERAKITPTEPHVGQALAVTPTGTDPDGDELKYTYVWKVNGKEVTDRGEASTFKTDGLRKKDMIYASLTASDWETESKEIDSDIVVLVNAAPEITSTPPVVSDEVYTYQVVARDPDKDKLTFSLEKYPPGMTISSTGLIRWELPKEVAQKQEIPVKIKIDDGDGGSAYQEYSLFLQMQ